MLTTEWHSVLIDQDVDDDLSSAVDLEGTYEFLSVIIPTLDGAHTTTITAGMTKTGTFYPVHCLKTEATGSSAQITTGATTAQLIIFRIGGARFIKVLVSTGVTTDKTFYVKGFNRSE